MTGDVSAGEAIRSARDRLWHSPNGKTRFGCNPKSRKAPSAVGAFPKLHNLPQSAQPNERCDLQPSRSVRRRDIRIVAGRDRH